MEINKESTWVKVYGKYNAIKQEYLYRSLTY